MCKLVNNNTLYICKLLCCCLSQTRFINLFRTPLVIRNIANLTGVTEIGGSGGINLVCDNNFQLDSCCFVM